MLVSFVYMRIHKEGYRTLLLVSSVLLVVNLALVFFAGAGKTVVWPVAGLSVLLLVYFTQFFRNPKRDPGPGSKGMLSPADGKVVVIEETEENEYFGDRRLQVSVFMSPYNVHSNRCPVAGEVVYARYHPGKFLVAWHPKSSVLNEHATIVIKPDDGPEIMVKQIAGAVARRIVTYLKAGDRVEKGQELGFIKFGSRVDIFLPPGTKIETGLGTKVRAGLSELTYDYK